LNNIISRVFIIGLFCFGYGQLALAETGFSKENSFEVRQSLQVDSSLYKGRLIGLGVGFGTAYSAGMAGLHYAWYRHQAKRSFHFYNDNSHWLQMDKSGHFWAAFQQSRVGVGSLKWAGLSDKKAIWYGGMLGIVMQTPIEIFDGFGEGYGFSIGDQLANMAGSGALIMQYLIWDEVKIMPKFSFRRTHFAPQRMEMLGDSFAEQLLKDYNGQSYWLSFDMDLFLGKETWWPTWLNIAVGYGASGMLYGDPVENKLNGHQAYRRFFISPDINLMKIKTNNRYLKTLFSAFNMVRVPLPAIEWNTQGQIIFHPIFY
jgi:hypothetical protein